MANMMMYANGIGTFKREAAQKAQAEDLATKLGTVKAVGGKRYMWDGYKWNTTKKPVQEGQGPSRNEPGWKDYAKTIGGTSSKVKYEDTPSNALAKSGTDTDPAKQQAYQQLIKSPPPGIPAAAWAETVRQQLGLTEAQVNQKPTNAMAGRTLQSAPDASATQPAPYTQAAPPPQDILSVAGPWAGTTIFPNDPQKAEAFNQAYQKNQAAGPEVAAQAAWYAGEAANPEWNALKETALARDAAAVAQNPAIANQDFKNDPMYQAGNWVADRTTDLSNFVAPVLNPLLGAVGLPAIGFAVSTATSPDPAGFMNQGTIDQVAKDNPAVTADWHNGTQQINPQYPFSPTGDAVGPERPGDVQLNQTTAPVYPTPTGAQIPATNPTGQWSGGQPAATQNGTTTPVVGAAAGAAATGAAGATGTGSTTGATGAPTGNWWENPAALAALATAVSGGSALWAGNQQAEAIEKASAAQTKAMENALALQGSQFNTQQENIKPWLDYGKGALIELDNFDQTDPNFGTAQFQVDPGYAFRLKEGMKALENSASARGNLLSGNTMKGITNYGQEAASQEYNNAFNRYNAQRGMKLNRLQSMAGIGQSAVQQVNQAGQNYANNAGNLMTGGANAQAQGMTGAADARASGWMGAGNSFINGLNNYYANQQSQNMSNALMGMFGK